MYYSILYNTISYYVIVYYTTFYYTLLYETTHITLLHIIFTLQYDDDHRLDPTIHLLHGIFAMLLVFRTDWFWQIIKIYLGLYNFLVYPLYNSQHTLLSSSWAQFVDLFVTVLMLFSATIFMSFYDKIFCLLRHNISFFPDTIFLSF